MWTDPHVDGVKTGQTEQAGWCLIASARREQGGVERRLLSVVLGATSDSARASETQRLLNWGFQSTEAVRLFARDQAAVTLKVWKGTAPELKA
ncbi:MAG: D-alanyl-D-alanine carboxypeptidase, partial [bacterium]